MKECPVCRRCFPDHVNHCPDDGDATTQSIAGDPVLDGRYQLERRLGHGGMGVVFQARHIFLKTAHAIKIILPDLVGNDPMLVTRFRQEALAAAAIRHPNIIAVTDFGVVRGTMPFLVMEFVSGQSLHEMLAQEGALPPGRALEIISAVGAGVAAAHRQGIIHRDLKPLNVMFQEGLPTAEAVKVLDFGLAKIKSGELLGSFVQAKTSGLMGSPFYMAPEQWSDEEPDARADIYSLGVILYQMLGGDVPFKGTSIPSIMKKHLTEPPPPLASLGVQVPPEIEAVVHHALEKEAENRPASVTDFINELRAAVDAVSASLNRTSFNSVNTQPQTIITSPGSTSLPPDTTTLRIQTSQPNSRVYVNNVSVGLTDSAGRLIVPDMMRGTHRVQVLHDGYAEWNQQIECAGGFCDVEARLLSLIETSGQHPSVFGHHSLEEHDSVGSGSIPPNMYQSQAALEAQRLRQQAEALEEQARQEALQIEQARREQEERERLAREEEEARKRVAEEARLKAEEEARLRAEEEARLAAAAAAQRLAEEAARLKAEEERVRLLAEEQERQRLAEEARLKAEAEERERQEAEAARVKAAEEARRQAEEAERERQAEAERQRLETEARQRAEEEKRQAEETERKRAEEARLAAEAEAKRLAEEEAARVRAAEEARQLALAELRKREEQEQAAAAERERLARQSRELASREQLELQEQAARNAPTIQPGPLPEINLDATQTQRQGVITQPVDEESLHEDARTSGSLGVPPTTQPNQRVQQTVPPPFQSSMPGVDTAKPPRTGVSTGLIAAIVGIVLVGGGLGVWYMLPKNQNSNNGNLGTPSPTATATATATASAKPTDSPGKGETPPPIKPELVSIPGGTMEIGRGDGTQGGDATPTEGPTHLVVVKPFAIDKTEVTNAEYAQFVSETKRTPPSNWAGSVPFAGSEMLPVVNVSYDDAVEFAKWRSKRDGVTYRLPTEEEWEYAARGGDQGNLYPWGNSWVSGRAGVKDSGVVGPKPVGSYPEDKTRWGVLDMAGNVYEWTSSKATMYPGNPLKLPAAQKNWIIVRGAAFVTDYKQKNPTTFRDWFPPTTKEAVLGFRLVRVG